MENENPLEQQLARLGQAVDPGESFVDQTMNRIEQTTMKPTPRAYRIRTWITRTGLAAAACLMIAMTGWSVYQADGQLATWDNDKPTTEAVGPLALLPVTPEAPATYDSLDVEDPLARTPSDDFLESRGFFDQSTSPGPPAQDDRVCLYVAEADGMLTADVMLAAGVETEAADPVVTSDMRVRYPRAAADFGSAPEAHEYLQTHSYGGRLLIRQQTKGVTQFIGLPFIVEPAPTEPVAPPEGTPGREIMTIDVEALIDGRDYLIIRQNTVQWRHMEWAIVGRHEPLNEPTIISTRQADTAIMDRHKWFPEWRDWKGQPLPGVRQPATSSIFTELQPSLPDRDMYVTLTPLDCRGVARVLQHPAAGNNHTLVVEFNDNKELGAVWYKIRLSVCEREQVCRHDGTIAHWRFDRNPLTSSASASDASLADVANGLRCTPLGGPVYRSVDGRVGLDFDGIDDRLFVPDHPSFALTKALTIEATIRFDGLNADSPQVNMIVFRGDDRVGVDPYFLAIGNDGRLFLHIGGCEHFVRVVSPEPLESGRWLHVAATFDGVAKLFIEGKEISWATTTVHPLTGLDPSSEPGIGIGSVQSANYPFWFDGMIAEVRISDYVRKPNEFLPFVGPDQSVSPTSTSGKTPGEVFVSDMPWASANAGADNPVRRDINLNGQLIAIANRVYEKGLWTHSYADETPADVVIDISGRNLAAFLADAGVEQSSDSGSVQFLVLVDGQKRAESPVMRPGMMHRFYVDVAGAKFVTLRVLNGGDGYNADHAAWGFARFVEAGGTSTQTVAPPCARGWGSDGLAAYYPLDGDTNDRSGNGCNAIAHGGAVFVDGVDQKAIRLDGVDDFLEIVNRGLLNSESTVAFWVKLNENGDFSLVSKALLANGYGIWLGRDTNFNQGVSGSGQVSFGFDGRGVHWNWHMITSDTEICPNQWYHIAAVLSDAGQTLYINGEERASHPTAERPSIDASIWLGREIRLGGGFLNGCLDEVRIFGRALSSHEVRGIYEKNVQPANDEDL